MANNNEEIIKRLEQESNEEYNEVINLTIKSGDIKCNDTDVKALSVTGFSVMAWAFSMLIMPFIVKTGVIPGELIQPLFVTLPTAAGVGGTIALHKVLKNKERLKKATTAKTEEERIIEASKTDIEKEKHKIKMNVFGNTAKKLKNKESTKNNIVTIKKDEIEKELSKNVKTAENLVIKKTLQERFWRIRNKKQLFKDTVLIASISTLLGFIIYNAPLIVMYSGENVYQMTTSIFELIAPGLISGIASTGYVIKQKSTEKKAFKKLNEELLKDDMLDDETNESEVNYDTEINNLIDLMTDLSLTFIQSQIPIENNEESKPEINKEHEDKLKTDLEPVYSDEEVEEYFLAQSLPEEKVEEKGITLTKK